MTTNAPPQGNFRKEQPPILEKIISAYKLWHGYFDHLPKLSRYAIGNRIDSRFLEFIESVYFGLYSPKENRNLVIEEISRKLDALKLLLRISWEIRILDTKKYSTLSIPLAEIGKIIGGWKK